jgi:hypothetical protein
MKPFITLINCKCTVNKSHKSAIFFVCLSTTSSTASASAPPPQDAAADPSDQLPKGQTPGDSATFEESEADTSSIFEGSEESQVDSQFK